MYKMTIGLCKGQAVSHSKTQVQSYARLHGTAVKKVTLTDILWLLEFFTLVIIPPMLHTHSFTCRGHYIISAIDKVIK